MAVFKHPNKKESQSLIAKINAALRNGHPPPGYRGRNTSIGAIRAVSEELEIYHTTLRRMLDYAKDNYGLEPSWDIWDPVLDESDDGISETETVISRRLVFLEDENADLRKKLRDMHRETLDAESIRQIIGGIIERPAQPPKWLLEKTSKAGVTQEVPLTIWSDWHVGEKVSISETAGVNEYGTSVFERRVKRLVSRTIDLCKNHGPGNYPGIVVNILGDMVSGGLHPELAKTDEEEVLPSILRVRDTLVTCLEHMAEAFKNVYVPCAAGNHGRTTPKPEYKRYVMKNADWLVYQLLARHFKGRNDIVFDIPESNEVHYRVFGRRYLAMHGDMIGVKGGDGIIGAIGPIMRGEMKVGRQQSVIGRDYDMLLMGHYHQSLWLPRAIVNNTLKGYDEYAKNVLRAPPSVPSQSLWLEHPVWGRTMHREVYLEDPEHDVSAPWVSVFGEK